MSDFLYDDFVATAPGQAFRLFPFGRIIKNGKVREITKELAALFKLPHFKPPIKLGDHAPPTPAGGHIVGLEVREDGLYALPEYNEQGAGALERGDYRYHSPEVVWDDGYLENPETGDQIQGPLIVGDALLHTPHLGEQAALYSRVEVQGGKPMTDTTVSVPVGIWERFLSAFDRATEPEPTPEPETVEVGVASEEYTVLMEERDDLAAKIETMEAEGKAQERVDHYAAELGDTALAEIEGAPERLAALSDEDADWFLQQIRALSEQIDTSALFSEKGSNDNPTLPDDPEEALNVSIRARMEEAKIGYGAALTQLANEQPDLFAGL